MAIRGDEAIYIVLALVLVLLLVPRQSQIFYKRMAELMAEKRGERKGFFTAWLRCKLSFSLVRSALLCLRGTRSSRTHRDDLGNTDFENVFMKSRLDVDLE